MSPEMRPKNFGAFGKRSWFALFLFVKEFKFSLTGFELFIAFQTAMLLETVRKKKPAVEVVCEG